MLHKFINKNLDIGEFVEIYRAWHDHEHFEFAAPTSEHTINLEVLLNAPMRMGTLAFEERHKLTIYKSG